MLTPRVNAYGNPPGREFFADAPHRIEPGKNIPLVAGIHDADEWLQSFTLQGIDIIDHKTGSKVLVEEFNEFIDDNLWYKNYDLDPLLFDRTDGMASIDVKFRIESWFDYTAPTINVKTSPTSLPSWAGWYAGDAHVHSSMTESGGVAGIGGEFGAPVDVIASSAKAMGLDWVILTDHSYDISPFPDEWNTYKGYCVGETITNEFVCMLGEEITCQDEFGVVEPFEPASHYLAYGISSPVKAPDWWGRDNNPTQQGAIIDVRDNKGGIGFIAHPFAQPWDWENWNPIGYTGIEIWNGGFDSSDQRAVEKWDELLGQGKKVFGIGNSDAHDLASIGSEVRNYVYLGDEDLTESNIIKALKNGRFIVTNGPLLSFTAGNHIVGDDCFICGNRLNLNIKWKSTVEYGAVTKITLFMNGVIVPGYPVDVNSYEGMRSEIVELPSTDLSYFRVQCETSSGRKAYTNPIWIRRLLSATLRPKESASFELLVETGPTPIPSIDVVLAIDRTGSMSDEIAVVKNKAVSIMNDIRTKVPDSWFGLVSFMDYPGSYSYPGYSAQYGSAAYGDVPYVVNQQPTDNTANVASAINGLSIGWGADEPQDYTRVLYETISLHWRALSKKILVLFGDAPTHDLNFAGHNFGGDPGRDAVARTADDLDFETVVGQVKDEGITVLAVQGSMYEPMRTYAEATFKGMSIGFDGAVGTSGQYFQLSTADQIPNVISTMVQEEVSKIKHLTLDIPDEYKNWVTFIPTEYTDVGPLTAKTFQVTITVPDGTAAGEHTFLIRVLGDGALLGSTVISIIVPSPGGVDLGFRANPNGFSFRNFGSDRTWEMFEQFFGRGAVRHSNGDRVYAAEQFFNRYYGPYVSGSCDGFAATSLINFEHLDQPNSGAFAMPYYDSLYSQGVNNDMRNAIAYQQGFWWSYETQFYMSALSEASGNSPRFFYGKIKEYISNGQPVILWIWEEPEWSGIWETGGAHALVPYRYEEPSENEAYVYVYDSNHPGDDNRRVIFDFRNDEWSYEFQKEWWIIPRVWEGDSSYLSMMTIPVDMRLHKGIALWTQDVLGDYADIVGSMGPASLLFTDESGHRLGFVNGQFVDEISRAIHIVPPVGEDVPFGLYYLPQGVSYNATICGTDQGTADITFFSDHSLIEIINATVHPSTVDNVKIGTGSMSLTYMTNDDHKDYSAIIDEEIVDASRIVTVKTDISSGELTTLELTDEQCFKYVNLGQPKTYDLVLEQRGPEAGYFSLHNLEIGAGETHVIRLENWNNLGSTEIYLETDKNSDGTIDEIKALTPPKTTLHIGSPQYKDTIGNLYVTSKTPFELTVEDIGSGVASTAYRIHNQTYDGGWTNYLQPFNLIGLSDGSYSINYNSTDNAGNVEGTNTQEVILDNTAPSLTIETPSQYAATQDGVDFTISATDLSAVASVMVSIRSARGNILSSQFELMPATLKQDGKWHLYFDTRQLPDGFYSFIANGTDVLGNWGTKTVKFSIRNWAAIQLLPSTPSNKAGRTMPIKFSIRVNASIDPAQPFIYNEELTIKIYKIASPSNVLLQTSNFGSGSTNYRIDTGTLYITNFKTQSTPATYLVNIYRKGMLIGSFQFSTVK